jgi:hypothetical protein
MLRVFGFRLLEDWDTDASILRERDEIFVSSECSNASAGRAVGTFKLEGVRAHQSRMG